MNDESLEHDEMKTRMSSIMMGTTWVTGNGFRNVGWIDIGEHVNGYEDMRED